MELCAGQCRIAQDNIIVVDVHDVLNNHLQSFIELLQLELADSHVALVKVSERPWNGIRHDPMDCASVVGASSDTPTLTSQMAYAARPACGLEITLQILQPGSGGLWGRAGVASVIMLVTTTANVYWNGWNGPLEEDPLLPFYAGSVGDTRVSPPR